MQKFVTLIKNTAFQIILLLIAYLLLTDIIPPVLHRALYSMSLLIKEVLIWLLPLTIASFIASSIASFEKKAPLFVMSLLVFELFSNLTSVWAAYAGAHSFSFAYYLSPLSVSNANFTPLFHLSLAKPFWWSSEYGMAAGLIIGAATALLKSRKLHGFINKSKQTMQWVLTNIFSKLLPIFVLGFFVKTFQTKLWAQMTQQYGMVIFALVIMLILYIALLFFFSAGFSLKRMAFSIKNLMPAGLLALTTGCSLSTMPWTIKGTSKNLQNPEFAQSVIPATTNIQQIGDCIANSFLCFLIYYQYFQYPPSFATWALFSIMFALARYATAAIMGGAIFVMLPIYENYLHFNPEMIALILAFNVLLDPIITSSNVIANGALCRIFEKQWLIISQGIFKPIKKI